MFHKSLKNTSLALVMGMAMAAASSTAFAGGDRLECDAESANEDASMDGKFESKGDREKFGASYEEAGGGSHMAGDVLQVRVDGAHVGDITLEGQPGGDIGGDLNFDTTAGPRDADQPFPANWPGAGAGTIVDVGTLGCSLQVR
jgi:hypothetical protein